MNTGWSGMETRAIFHPGARSRQSLGSRLAGKCRLPQAMSAATPEPASASEEELLSGQLLREALGFRTGEAFRAALRANRLPVPVVKIAGRRGWFARAVDVAEWRRRMSRDFDQATKGSAP